MKKILVFAAHPDDEALGCMGTLLYFKSKGYKIKICFMSDGESSRKLSPNKKEKLIKSRMEQAKLVSKKSKLIRPNFFNFPDNMLDTIPLLLIVKKVEKLFAICDELEAQISGSQASADELMQAVLKEAFTQEDKVA